MDLPVTLPALLPYFLKPNWPPYLRRKVEVEERNEVPLEQPGEEAEVYSVGELRVQIVHLEVDLVQVLIHESYKGFLHHL